MYAKWLAWFTTILGVVLLLLGGGGIVIGVVLEGAVSACLGALLIVLGTADQHKTLPAWRAWLAVLLPLAVVALVAARELLGWGK
jgi:hypothetical protein